MFVRRNSFRVKTRFVRGFDDKRVGDSARRGDCFRDYSDCVIADFLSVRYYYPVGACRNTYVPVGSSGVERYGGSFVSVMSFAGKRHQIARDARTSARDAAKTETHNSMYGECGDVPMAYMYARRLYEDPLVDPWCIGPIPRNVNDQRSSGSLFLSFPRKRRKSARISTRILSIFFGCYKRAGGTGEVVENGRREMRGAGGRGDKGMENGIHAMNTK